MKKIFSVFLSVIIFLSVMTVSAFSLETSGFTYELENGKAVITGYFGTHTALTVPSTLGGYTVFAIGENAFKSNMSLNSVTVSEGICEIRDSAFEDCQNLNEIILPTTVTRFGENAISNTAYYNNKDNWTIKPTASSSPDWSFGNGQDTYPWEFIKADELEYIYLGTVLVRCRVKGTYDPKFDTTVIADGAFRNEAGLKKTTISEKIVTVGASAFSGCTSLDNAVIGNPWCKIYEDAFLNTAIYNNESNWKGDFLCLGTRAVASKKETYELTVGDGVTSISNGLIGTKDVYIPSSVTYIDLDAFKGKKSVIYGFSGTYAESFAEDNGFAFVDLDSAVIGDMNFDGELTANDYAIYYASVTCAHRMTKYEQLVGDLTMDGAVDAFDVMYIEILINDKTAKTKGDANGDGAINRKDYDFLVGFIQQKYRTVGENVYCRCDINGDGAVDAFDAIYLDLYLNGKVSF